MRKIFISSILFIAFVSVHAQESQVITDLVSPPFGININMAEPSNWSREFSFSNGNFDKMFAIGAKAYGNTLHYGYIGGNHNGTIAYQNPWMTFSPEGNIGIGTTTPTAKLDIIDNQSNFSFRESGGSAQLRLGNNTTDGIAGIILDASNGDFSGSDYFYLYQDAGLDFNLESMHNSGDIIFRTKAGTFQAPEKESMRITKSGYIGIGTTNPQATLDVNGNIRAERIDVINDVPSSDYVFEADYNLRSLKEVENFVTENKHLPEVPSAAEFKENGYSVGQMDDILLRKVEELTLYMIDMQKQLNEKENRISELETKLENNSK